MAATEQPRRFITRTDVEDAATAGQPIQLGPRDIITDEAAERARDLHLRVDHTTSAGRQTVPTASRTGPAPPITTRVDAALRSAVRAAVIAELGEEPDGLDAALGKVLGRSPS